MSNKNRLAIFCFYEKDGFVDMYIYHLVEELFSIANKVIIVVNGKMEESAKKYFEQCGCNVFIRENQGYDATAYKYVIEIIGREELRNFQQIILCNDTFFGPFIPMKSVFEKMNMEKCDFWGITYQDKNLIQFIESYFLVFDKKIILSDDLWYFFESMQEIVEYQDALMYFEIGIFVYFKNKGYTHGALISKKKYFSNVKFPYENLKYEQLPILKKRAFTTKDDARLIEAINYIKNNYAYDISFIKSWMERKKIVLEENRELCEKDLLTVTNNISRLSIKDIYCFINQWKNVYIYGNGYYRHILIDLYHIKPKLIIISDDQTLEETQYRGIPIMLMSQIDLQDKEIGIIVALNRSNTETVKNFLGDGENVLYLW